MVAPIRDLGNLTHSSASISSISLKPTFDLDINMVKDPIKAMFNLNNEVRGCSLDLSIHNSRSPSPSPSTISNLSKEEYALHIQWESDRMDKDEPVKSSNKFSLEYVIQEGQNNQVSKVADFPPNTRMQDVPTADSTLNHLPSENMFNIHLNYNPNQAFVLRSMPPGDNMDIGKGYDDNDRLCCSSLSQYLMQ